MKQVNTVTKKLFHGISDDEMNDTLDIFWIEYTELNCKNGIFDCDDFIQSIKYIHEGNSHICHHKYYVLSTNLIGFVACRDTSKMICVGAAERSWGDVKTINNDKRSDISSYASKKQRIGYTSACIKSGKISRRKLDFNIDERYPRYL